MDPELMADPEQMAFELFADAYPHEAAEADQAKFVAYTRSRCGNPNISEEEILEILERTAGRATEKLERKKGKSHEEN